MRKVIILWACMGAVYMLMEGLWRGGWTHVSMFVVGGLCGIAVGGINQIPAFYKLPIIWQSLIGAVIVLAVEFASGCILNLWLGLGVWDYSGRWGNILGQVCIGYGLLWFVLMPFAIWLEDWLRWRLWREGESYTLGSVYLELVTLK